MLHKLSAWTHLSNFDQSEHKNWTYSVTNACPWREKSKATAFPCFARNSWLNFRVRGQIEIKILIVRLNSFLMHLKKWTWACDHLKTSKLSADKKFSMGRYLSPRYGQVILVSGYPVFTARLIVTISGCIWARKCEIKHCLPRDADGRSVGRSFCVRSRDYQIFWDG